MPKILYLICFKNPFDKEPYLFCKNDDSIHLERNVLVLKEFENIFCYGLEEIIDNCREQNLTLDQTFYDIVTAIKLLTGQPKSFYKSGNEPWNLKNILGSMVQSKHN